MARFKVGDKVIAKKNTPYAITDNGWKGEVTAINRYHNDIITVKGKNPFGGIDAWSVRSEYFDLDTSAYDQKIVITTDGTTTTAKMYHGKTVVKTATAKCAEGDKFDFDTGAKIAFGRLMDKPERKSLLNTKICIVDGDDEFKTGQIYDVIDGIIKKRDGFTIPSKGEFHSIEEVESYFSPREERKFFNGCGWSNEKIKFVEVVE